MMDNYSKEILTKKYEEAKAKFDLFLLKNKNRRTPERYAILEEIYVHLHHFDAESLYIRMKQNAYRVSRATIYNTLDILVECGMIKKHHFGANKTFFERAYGFEDHNHLICTECDKITEFVDTRLSGIVKDQSASANVQANYLSLNIFGICEECRK
jgi:Fur family ferric uptake transcriptional regulator